MNTFEFLDAMRATNSRTEKERILNSLPKDGEIVDILKMAYDENVVYRISRKQLDDHTDLCAIALTNVGDWKAGLDILIQKILDGSIRGNWAIACCNGYIINYPEHKELLKQILDRDLRIGVTVDTLKKIFPKTFPTYKVTLAEIFDEKTSKKVDFEKDDWWASRKLDGVRCVCFKKGDTVIFKSRQNKQFTTLSVLEEEIKKIPGDFVLDGECCVVDSEGNEDFRTIVSEIGKKNHTVANPHYYVFDCLTWDEFIPGEGTVKFSERMQREPITYIRETGTNIFVLHQAIVRNQEDFDEWDDKVSKYGWEGFMLKKDLPYKSGRSTNMLKVKKFQDAEYEIVDVNTGMMRVVENGVQVDKLLMSDVTIIHKGNEVHVGTGWSLAERTYYKDHPEELKGRTITVKYFQESTDKDGRPSLRFPTKKYLYLDGRNL